MSATRRRNARTVSAASFYNYGPPALSEYGTPSLPGSRFSTPKLGHSTTRTGRPRRPSSQSTVTTGIPHLDGDTPPSSPDTPRALDPSPSGSHPPSSSSWYAPVITDSPRSLAYVSRDASTPTTPLHHVRFDSSPEVIEWSMELEYEAPPGVDVEIWKAFVAADTDGSGVIDPRELQTALVNSPSNQPFEPATISMLIDMFDLNHNSTIEFWEFVGLSEYVKKWREEFEQADRDHSGTIDAKELKKALARFGYNLPLRVIKKLHRKYVATRTRTRRTRPGDADESDGISFDQFLRACLAVQNLAAAFEKFNSDDHSGQGQADFAGFVMAAISVGDK